MKKEKLIFLPGLFFNSMAVILLTFSFLYLQDGNIFSSGIKGDIFHLLIKHDYVSHIHPQTESTEINVHPDLDFYLLSTCSIRNYLFIEYNDYITLIYNTGITPHLTNGPCLFKSNRAPPFVA